MLLNKYNLKNNIYNLINISKEFKEYVKRNYIIIFITWFSFLFIYSMWLFNNPMHIDSIFFIQKPMCKYNWIALNRWALYLTKYLTNGWWFNLFFEKIIGYNLIAFSGVLCSFLLSRFYKKHEKLINFFYLIVLASPLLTELLYFELQLIGIGLGFILVMISAILNIYFVIKLINENKKLYLIGITGIISGVLATGIYQSFLNVYVSLILFVFILILINKQEYIDNFNKIKKYLIYLISQIVIIFIANQLIVSVFCRGDNFDGYLTILWVKESFCKVLIHVIRNILSVLVASNTAFFSKSFFIILFINALIVLYLTFENKKNLMLLSTLAFLDLSTFLMIIICGYILGYRMLITYSFVAYFNVLLFINLMSKIKDNIRYKKVLKIISIFIGVVFLFQSIQKVERLLYTDYVRDKENIRTISRISLDLDKININKNKPIAVIGNYRDVKSSNKGIIGDCGIIGCNVIAWGIKYFPHYFFAEALGINSKMKLANKKQFKKARKIGKKMPAYPMNGYMKECDDFIIIKVGNLDD